jgi:sporulation protein YlmC with PRC-barrel domain
MIVSAARIAGNAVVDPDGDEVGRLDRLMVEVPTGRIVHAVIAFGGVLGIGERRCAVAWQHLALDPARRCFVLRPHEQSRAPSASV